MLETLANLAQVFGAVAVAAAIGFGVAQIRQFRQQRRDALAVELMRSIQDTEFTRSLRMLLELPPNATVADIRSRGVAFEDATWALASKYETLGYLVFRGIMPFELVEELVGGVGVHLWNRIRPWAIAVREEQGQPLLLEWFQWLAERMDERGRPNAIPSYVKHRDWTTPQRLPVVLAFLLSAATSAYSQRPQLIERNACEGEGCEVQYVAIASGTIPVYATDSDTGEVAAPDPDD